jgi:chemotaxis family two-component system response regulator Rcp1
LTPSPHRISVVYIDDKSGDQRLISEALKESQTPCQLTVLTSRPAAMRYFAGTSQTEVRPDLILLDLHLGPIDGCELVAYIRAVPQWRTVPILVFAPSPSDPAALRALQLGANDCLTRPADLDHLFEQVEGIVSRWIGRSEQYSEAIA